jgi:hypothetical protein
MNKYNLKLNNNNNLIKEFTKVKTYEEIIGELDNFKNSLTYPNRDARFYRETNQLQRYDDMDLGGTEEEHNNVIKHQMRLTALKNITDKTIPYAARRYYLDTESSLDYTDKKLLLNNLDNEHDEIDDIKTDADNIIEKGNKLKKLKEMKKSRKKIFPSAPELVESLLFTKDLKSAAVDVALKTGVNILSGKEKASGSGDVKQKYDDDDDEDIDDVESTDVDNLNESERDKIDKAKLTPSKIKPHNMTDVYKKLKNEKKLNEGEYKTYIQKYNKAYASVISLDEKKKVIKEIKADYTNLYNRLKKEKVNLLDLTRDIF